MITRFKVLGWSLIVIGIVVMVFSRTIVFPGLERIVGIEIIVGEQNVYPQPDDGYYFTNPGAMVRWIAAVVAVGVLVVMIGFGCILRTRRSANETPEPTAPSVFDFMFFFFMRVFVPSERALTGAAAQLCR